MKDKEHIEGLFTQAGCLTLETIKRYNASSLSFEEKIQIEKHLEDCELCRDALEGLLLVSDPDKIDSIVSEINRNLKSDLATKKSDKTVRSILIQNRMYYIAAAASVLIFIGIFSYFKFYMQDQNSELSVVTEKTQTEQKEDFKSVAEDSKFEAMEEEAEELIPVPPAEEEANNMAIPDKIKDDIPEKEIESDQKIVIDGISIPESDESEVVDIIEEALMEQPSVAGSSEEPTEYVIGSIALNGKGTNTERLSFDENLESEKEQFNSKALGTKPAAAKKGKSRFSAESVSDNMVKEDSLQDEYKQVFTVVEKLPEFPGGLDSLDIFLQQNLIYPDSAIAAGIQGTVYISFVVNESGKIEDAKVERGIGGGCDEEALQLVKSMPDWIPGEQRRKPVNVQFVMPIEFKLDN